MWFAVVICCDPDRLSLLSVLENRGVTGAVVGATPSLYLGCSGWRSTEPQCWGWGSELACGFLPCLPPSPQGDIQELLISADPQAAFQACERYLPACDHLDPAATGVSERLVLRSQAESASASGLRDE